MIYEDLLSHYLALGVTWERFMDSCPKELKAYDKAHKLQIEEQDILMHAWFGNYAASAFYVAIDHSFNPKAKSEYIKEPIYKASFEDEKLTEEEKEEREMQKALWKEEQWIMAAKRKGLPETVFKLNALYGKIYDRKCALEVVHE